MQEEIVKKLSKRTVRGKELLSGKYFSLTDRYFSSPHLTPAGIKLKSRHLQQNRIYSDISRIAAAPNTAYAIWITRQIFMIIFRTSSFL